jgi:hypothetical protein
MDAFNTFVPTFEGSFASHFAGVHAFEAQQASESELAFPQLPQYPGGHTYQSNTWYSDLGGCLNQYGSLSDT